METLKNFDFIYYLNKQNIIYALGTYSAFTVLKFFLKKAKQISIQNRYKRIIKQYLQKRAQQLFSLDIEEPNFSQEFIEQILNSSVSQLKQLLENGRITSEQLLNLYAKRAYTIGSKYNWITVDNYKDALIEAKKCDNLRKENSPLCKGELFGVVISVKDSFDLKDTPSTIGCASRLNYIPKKDGLAIKVLKQSGAIVFVKSNLPQAGMIIESVNNIFGRGVNPWDKSRNIGGSTGGEGALIAGRCSPLGIGSDIGGSIRNPAAMNGITSIKPTCERINLKGHTSFTPGMDGQGTIKIAIGPLSKYVDDSVYMMKALLNDNYHNSLPLSEQAQYHTNRPWNENEYQSNRKLKIAYFKSLEAFTPPTCVQRGVQESVEALTQNGHELVEIKFPFEKECIKLFLQIIASDKYDSLVEMLKDEKPTEFNSRLTILVNLSDCARKVILSLLKLLGQKRVASLGKNAKGLTASEYRQVSYQVQAIRQKFVEYMELNKFEAIICPAHGIPAGSHDYSCDLLDALHFESSFNVLNVPAGVVPVSVIKENEQNYDINDGHNDMQRNVCKREMKNSKGLPLTVQVVGLPMQEELVMNIMKQIEDNVQFHKQHPYPNIN